jgi:Uncharacterized conserved protein
MDNKEIELIKTAILNEAEGEKFYKKAAQDVQDQEAGNTFIDLAEDEKRHQTMLRRMLAQLPADVDVQLDILKLDGTADSSISDAVRNMDTNNAMELSIFHMATMMENASIDYYRKAAAQTSWADARDFYERMIDWEMQHLEVLEKVYDPLQEEWWDKQSYSPS